MKHKEIEIITDRLVLRVPSLEDARAINDALQDVWPELQLWMSWAYDGQNTLEATQNYIRFSNEDDNNLPLIGLCRESGRFVISTGFLLREGRHDTGYWVAKDFLGRGYATESTNAVIRYAFDQMKADCIGISYYEGNDKSRRVIEKLNFTPKGVKPENHVRCSDGTMIDEHFFDMRDPSVLPPLNVRW